VVTKSLAVGRAAGPTRAACRGEDRYGRRTSTEVARLLPCLRCPPAPMPLAVRGVPRGGADGRVDALHDLCALSDRQRRAGRRHSALRVFSAPLCPPANSICGPCEASRVRAAPQAKPLPRMLERRSGFASFRGASGGGPARPRSGQQVSHGRNAQSVPRKPSATHGLEFPLVPRSAGWPPERSLICSTLHLLSSDVTPASSPIASRAAASHFAGLADGRTLRAWLGSGQRSSRGPSEGSFPAARAWWVRRLLVLLAGSCG